MDPLLKITTVPITFELKVNNARLEYKRGTADLEISKSKGGFKMKSRPIKVNIDTYEARNSVVPTTKTSIAQAAQNGKRAAYEATAQWAQDGQLLLKASANVGQDVLGQIASRAMDRSDNFELDFIPKTGPNITWSQPDLSIQYEMDKLNFDWKMSGQQFEFVPGDIEINITQYPDVVIEYVGSPLYVPPSADPNYTPIDVKA